MSPNIQMQNAENYIAALRADIRSHVCEPFQISAIVMEPGFPDVPAGSVLTGQCVTFREAIGWSMNQRRIAFSASELTVQACH
jgi:hypothetical protein